MVTVKSIMVVRPSFSRGKWTKQKGVKDVREEGGWLSDDGFHRGTELFSPVIEELAKFWI